MQPPVRGLKGQNFIATPGQIEQEVCEFLQKRVVAAVEQDSPPLVSGGRDPPAWECAAFIGNLIPVNGAALGAEKVGKLA